MKQRVLMICSYMILNMFCYFEKSLVGVSVRTAVTGMSFIEEVIKHTHHGKGAEPTHSNNAS